MISTSCVGEKKEVYRSSAVEKLAREDTVSDIKRDMSSEPTGVAFYPDRRWPTFGDYGRAQAPQSLCAPPSSRPWGLSQSAQFSVPVPRWPKRREEPTDRVRARIRLSTVPSPTTAKQIRGTQAAT